MLEEDIRKLYREIADTYQLDRKRVSLWIASGRAEDSCVLIGTEAEKLDYELIFYITNKEVNYYILLHELGHIIFLENYVKRYGIEQANKLLDQHDKEIEKINRYSDQTKSTELYKQTLLESEADKIASVLQNRYKRGDINGAS